MTDRMGSYGSVDSSMPLFEPVGFGENRDELPYDLDNSFYLKNNSNSDSKTTWKKCCSKAIVPLLVSTIIVGGCTWALWRDFGHLYPGRGGNNPNGKRGGNDIVINSSSSTSAADDDGLPSTASCVENSICAALNLTGFCCPTVDGVSLSCCDDQSEDLNWKL